MVVVNEEPPFDPALAAKTAYELNESSDLYRRGIEILFPDENGAADSDEADDADLSAETGDA